MEMGQFLNTFVADPQTFWTLVIALLVFLVLFAWRYDAWIQRLGSHINGYVAFLVAGATLVTIGAMALLSWKAALLAVLLFGVDGSIMIIGDVRRSIRAQEKEKKATSIRRKPLPYAAAGLMDEASMSLAEAQRGIRSVLEGKGDDRKLGLIALAISTAIQKLHEARKVEGD